MTCVVQNHPTVNTNPIICQIRFPVSWCDLRSKAFLWLLSLGSQYDVSPSNTCQCLFHTHLEHVISDQFSLQAAGARIHILPAVYKAIPSFVDEHNRHHSTFYPKSVSPSQQYLAQRFPLNTFSQNNNLILTTWVLMSGALSNDRKTYLA